jgi:hypothetical protein
MRRKKDGEKVPWQRTGARPRIRMAPFSYLDRELIATNLLGTAEEAVQEAAREAVNQAAPEDRTDPGTITEPPA